MKIKKCPACGKNSFYLHEKLIHEAEYDKDSKKMIAHQEQPDGIEKIECRKCGWIEEYPQLGEVEFC